jgi:hypothetical protein
VVISELRNIANVPPCDSSTSFQTKSTLEKSTEREMAEASSAVPAEGGGDDTAKVERF